MLFLNFLWMHSADGNNILVAHEHRWKQGWTERRTNETVLWWSCFKRGQSERMTKQRVAKGGRTEGQTERRTDRKLRTDRKKDRQKRVSTSRRPPRHRRSRRTPLAKNDGFAAFSCNSSSMATPIGSLSRKASLGTVPTHRPLRWWVGGLAGVVVVDDPAAAAAAALLRFGKVFGVGR